ncbi:MAG: endonuclease MutS2 [Bacteroidota bacterium]
MNYPKDFEYKVGFDQVRAILDSFCLSSLGKKKIAAIQMSLDFSVINEYLSQTEEFRQILIMGESFPASNYFDLDEVFEKVKFEGSFFETEEMRDLMLSLETILKIKKFLLQKLNSETYKYNELSKLAEQIDIPQEIITYIQKLIDHQGNIKSSASVDLANIRKKRSALESKAGNRINQILQQAKSEKWLESNVELSLSNGRLVIPVPAAYKRRVKGYIHDQSATGQTIYLEPEEVFEINNEIRELDFEEQQEIIRILKVFTDFFRPHLPAVKSAYNFLGIIDSIRAKAKFAMEINAMMPKLLDKPYMNWVNATHPLLFLSFKSQKKKVEPLSVFLNENQRILIISGPNAGGKSVALKTCGLLQYMVQCGLLVPMESYSEVGIFENLFIDIGDEQSIENDLSTYSSHLLNMKNFCENIDKKSLFLIDEFGAGTEPKIGGSIAEAILNDLNAKKAFGVITTHYANLKLMASKNEEIVNASMLFDTKNIRPLYRLKIGNPGSSFAFEIARTIGLPDNILKTAGEIAGTTEVDFDKQLQDMDLKKLELEDKEKQLKAADDFLSEMIDKYENLYKDVEQRKQEIINEARKEAKSILAKSNSIIEKAVKEIKESHADKAKTLQTRQEIKEFVEKLQDEIINTDEASSDRKKKKDRKKGIVKTEPELDNTPISVSNTVRMKGLHTTGEVISLEGKDAVVSFGNMKMKVPLAKLEKIKVDKKSSSQSKVKLSFDINEKAADFSPHIDVRGARAEDGLRKVRRFIDDAVLLSARNLKIVHGKGDGILREAIRDMLRTIPEVKKFKDDHPDRGGAGTTIVELNI